ncbi:MAG: endonuclease domain-containing protein [Nitratireductor sp.]
MRYRICYSFHWPDRSIVLRHKVPKTHREFARKMRREPTDAEAALWSMLRGRQLEGLRFRRQHPIAGYIVDFVCLDAKLIVEADGEQHAESSRDSVRDAQLVALGYTVLRYWNNEILQNSDGVAQDILHYAGRL